MHNDFKIIRASDIDFDKILKSMSKEEIEQYNRELLEAKELAKKSTTIIYQQEKGV